MLRGLSRSSNAAKASSDELTKRLEHAQQQRTVAEEALVEARVANTELKTRIAELEGAPAAREHATRQRALEGAHARLAAAKEAHTHEQDVLRDALAEKERALEALEHRLRGVDHGAREHEARSARLEAELEEARLALAEERKTRYLSEDRLRAAEQKTGGEAARRAQAAEAQLAAMSTESARREALLGQLKGAAEAHVAEKERLRAESAALAQSNADKERDLATARASLELVRTALSSGGTLAGACPLWRLLRCPYRPPVLGLHWTPCRSRHM